MSDAKTETKIDPSTTAIILIEYQNEFTTEGGALYPAVKACMEKTDMLKKSRILMDDARKVLYPTLLQYPPYPTLP